MAAEPCLKLDDHVNVLLEIFVYILFLNVVFRPVPVSFLMCNIFFSFGSTCVSVLFLIKFPNFHLLTLNVYMMLLTSMLNSAASSLPSVQQLFVVQ